jgi:hypothetical protein
VLVLCGGADAIGAEYLGVLQDVVRDEVLPVLDACGAAVVDGGTDSGVMRVIGRARDIARAEFPLVGVAAEGTVFGPGAAEPTSSDAAAIEPHHTHVVLVPGRAWGDESPWLAEVARAVANGHASATLVVNGGEITYKDIDRSLSDRRPTLVVAGSGRAADAIAAAAGNAGADPRANRIAASPLTQILRIDVPGEIAQALGAALRPGR